MKFRITHQTTYDYTEPVTVSHHSARVEPRLTSTQRSEAFQLAIDPVPAVKKWHTDYFGNRLCCFSIQEIHRHLAVAATSSVVVVRARPLEPESSLAWDQVARLFRDPVSPDVVEPYQFCFDSPLLTNSPALADYARGSFPAGRPLLEGVQDLNRRIFSDFKYDPVATTVATPLEDVLTKRRGVCQDFAHLAIASLRSLGLAARYVSGYLRTTPLPGKPRLQGADASHAWFAAFCPRTGWIDFDPTNNLLPSK